MLQRNRLILLSILFSVFANDAFAQDADGKQFARQLEELKARQTAIERKLDEVLRTLRSMQASRLAQPPSPAAAAARVRINVTGAAFKGSPTAPVTLIEFSDYECGFCRRHATQTLPLIDQNYIQPGKVKYVFKNFPADQHKLAFSAHQAAACAGDQGKYWEMHDRLFASPAALAALTQQATALGVAVPMFQQCLQTGKHAEKIRGDIAAGRAAGVKGTPMFYVGLSSADGMVEVMQTITGAKQYAVFVQALDAVAVQISGKVVN